MKPNFAKKKIRLNQILRIFSTIIFLGLLIYTISLLPTLFKMSSSYGIIGAIFTLGFILYIKNSIKSTHKEFIEILATTGKNIKNATKGNNAEIEVYQELQRLLVNHQIYRNFNIPKTTFDFDLLVVGPTGLIVFEVKNWNKHTSFLNPTKKVSQRLNNNCHILKSFLSQQDSVLENIYIDRALIDFSGEMYKPHKPGVWIINGKRSIEKYLKNRFSHTLNQEVQSKLNTIFSTLS